MLSSCYHLLKAKWLLKKGDIYHITINIFIKKEKKKNRWRLIHTTDENTMLPFPLFLEVQIIFIFLWTIDHIFSFITDSASEQKKRNKGAYFSETIYIPIISITKCPLTAQTPFPCNFPAVNSYVRLASKRTLQIHECSNGHCSVIGRGHCRNLAIQTKWNMISELHRMEVFSTFICNM